MKGSLHCRERVLFHPSTNSAQVRKAQTVTGLCNSLSNIGSLANDLVFDEKM